MTKEYTTNLYDYWFIAIEPAYKRVKYSFVLESGEERILYGCRSTEDLKVSQEKEKDLFNYFNYPFINTADIFKAPEWVKKTVWYQIFPERFCNGNQENDPEGVLPWGSVTKVTNSMFFGGDLDGVIQKLDYIQDLGASGIYFTPLFTSPTSHKYDTENYFEIDPQFGDLESMKTLVQEAHKRGIKVMLDAVFNHCGWNHPFFQDVLKNGEQSPYKDYFHIKDFPVFEGDPNKFKFVHGENQLNYDTFAFTPFMPKWNTEHPEVVEYLLKVATYWITEFDIDAWRLDVSNEVDHAFWKKFRTACDAVKEDFFIVGENWDESTPWLQPDQMQSVMNYEFMFPAWNYFGKEISNAEQFKEEVSKVLSTYPKTVSPYLFNLLDSHDTTRILTICEGNKQKAMLAYLFLLTFGGTPSIYYGGEIGLEGGHDPDNRRCMIWEEEQQDQSMFKHIQTLIKLRNDHAALREVDLSWVDVNPATNHIIYKKEADGETIYIIMNNQAHPLPLIINELDGKTVTDLYHQKSITIDGTSSIDAYGFMILKA